MLNFRGVIKQAPIKKNDKESNIVPNVLNKNKDQQAK